MIRCGASLPGPPGEPALLDVGHSGDALILHFTLTANAETYNFYEFSGVVVAEGYLVQKFCHVGPADPAFHDNGDGTATFTLMPGRDLTSYLVSASNWIAESSIGDGSGGQLDQPPSAFRCGANP